MSLYLLRISKTTTLYSQLCLEESLFRRTNDSWLIIRDGSSTMNSTNNNYLKGFNPVHFDGPDVYYNNNQFQSSNKSVISSLYEFIDKDKDVSSLDNVAEIKNKLPASDMSKPVIVVGLSGKVNELVDVDKAKRDNIPMIRRFTGGGTVINDENTMIVSLIFGSRKNTNKLSYLPNPFPRDIMSWTSKMIYQKAFDSLCGSDSGFRLRENDYVILDGKKMGGNAQAISGERWLHHTSFLWDYKNENMDYLLHPKKTPEYRSGREHKDFLCRIKDHVKPSNKNNRESLTEEIIRQLSGYYNLIPITSESSYPFPSLTIESYDYRSKFLR